MLNGLKIIETINEAEVMKEAIQYFNEKKIEGNKFLFILFREENTFLFPCLLNLPETEAHLKNKYQANKIKTLSLNEG
jgi:hypothetical protein